MYGYSHQWATVDDEGYATVPHIYPDDPDNRKFKGGTGWLKRFCDRHGVRSLSMQRESLSAAIIEVEPFKKRFQEELKKGV